MVQTAEIAAAPGRTESSRRRADMLLRGPVLATVLRLALPNVVIMLAQAAANFLESYYVGLLGLEALAGAALVFPLVMLIQMLSAGGIGGGISSAVARAMGAGRHEEAESLAWHAVLIAIGLGALSSALLLLCGPALYRLMGGRGEVLHAALGYSNAIFAGCILLWLSNALASVLRGTGNMVLPAMVLTGGIFVLFALSPALIFGIGPVPALGITGAGLALVGYYLISATVLLVALLRGRSGFRLSTRHPIQRKHFAAILGVGGAAAVNNLNANLAVTVATSFVAGLGTHALAGFGLGTRLEYLQIPIVFGVGSGMVAMIGMNVGAGQLVRAKRIAWVGSLVAAAATEIVGLMAALFPAAWLGLFTTDPAAIATGSTYLHIVAPIYGVFGLGQALYFASQGAKQMKWSVLAGFARLAVVGIGGWAVGQLTAPTVAHLSIVLVIGFIAMAATNAVPWLRPVGRAGEAL